jgi:hypothetical protein
MSVISQIVAIARAVEILEPLIEQVAEWVKGGAKPEFMTTLPMVARSRIAYNAAKLRVRG